MINKDDFKIKSNLICLVVVGVWSVVYSRIKTKASKFYNWEIHALHPLLSLAIFIFIKALTIELQA